MYRLTDKGRTIVERARAITSESIAPHASRIDEEATYPQESIEALAQGGFMGLIVPEEFGGMGQDSSVMVAVIEQIARTCSSTALCYLVHLAGTAAYAAAKPPREDLLRSAAAGEHVSTLALGEFGSRSHFWVPMSQAARRNGKIVLEARKAFVTSAGHADGYVVITRSAESESGTDTTLYYVPANDPGLRVSGAWDALGMRGNVSAPMVLQEVELPPSEALSSPGGGMTMLLDILLPIINLGVCAICLGIAEASIEITQKHLMNSELEHLSLRLADLPNQRARLARMRLETDKARAHVVMTLEAIEQTKADATMMVLESKVAAADMVLLVTDLALKAAGGTAFNRRLGLERRFRDARAADVTGITSDLLIEFIGRMLCDMPVP